MLNDRIRARLSGVAAVVLASSLAVAASAGEAATLKVDPQHTRVGFKVRHLFTKVNGQFRDFQGTLEFDETTSTLANLVATIQTVSVDTNVEARDKDLRSKRFFDVEKYPTLTFRSTGATKLAGNKGQIRGVLTMHGVEKEIVLDAEFLGKGKDPWGNVRFGFQARATINRKDWGMEWNEVLEAGGVLVGDEVEITLDVEAMPAT
jgi:polyisoprenoid-binding protein YceI